MTVTLVLAPAAFYSGLGLALVGVLPYWILVAPLVSMPLAWVGWHDTEVDPPTYDE
jgi:hypothetical protein